MSTEPSIQVGRTLSQTPLSRLHGRVLAGKSPRRNKAIPWAAFNRKAYPEPALGLALDLCRGLARGEYAAIGLFSYVTTGLARTGAPLDVILAASSVSSDEARHADYCLAMASKLTEEEVIVDVPVRAVAAGLPEPDLETVDHLMLEQVAIMETLAAALLTACRRRSSDPVARAFFTALVSDELHHARLGWYYAAHRVGSWDAPARRRLSQRIRPFLSVIEQQFWVGRDAPAGVEPAARALGVLDSETQRNVIASVMEGEIVPALDALGLGGSRAWKQRRRGPRA